MKHTAAFLVTTLSLSQAFAQAPEPVIDMHLHAHGADLNGPPPTHICPGGAMPVHDPARAWAEVFREHGKNPPCTEPLRGAESGEDL